MKCVSFPEQNGELTKPVGTTDEQCGTLPCWRGPILIDEFANTTPGIISAWQPDESDIRRVNAGGPLYLALWGETMPPASIFTENPFGNENPNTQALPLKQAIARLREALTTDPAYYYGWQSNIAMAFADELDHMALTGERFSTGIKDVANCAAKRFLETLCNSAEGLNSSWAQAVVTNNEPVHVSETNQEDKPGVFCMTFQEPAEDGRLVLNPASVTVADVEKFVGTANLKAFTGVTSVCVNQRLGHAWVKLDNGLLLVRKDHQLYAPAVELKALTEAYNDIPTDAQLNEPMINDMLARMKVLRDLLREPDAPMFSPDRV